MPEDLIDFQDAMVFAMNYGVVSPRVVPFLPEVADGGLTLVLAERGSVQEMSWSSYLGLRGTWRR